MDIEVPVREPRTFSDIKRQHKHVLNLETVLFSVFYPSGFGSGEGPSPEGEKKWSRATWLPRPRVEMAKGYSKFAGLPSWPTIAWFGMTTAFTKLPAFRNAKLATHWPPENARESESGYQTKNSAGDPPPGEPESPCFPLKCQRYFPGNKQGVDRELRSAQIQLRLAEIDEAYHVMTQIRDGNGSLVAEANLRQHSPGRMGGSSRGLKGIDWKKLEKPLPSPARILYDPWGGAIQQAGSDSEYQIHNPLLCINSEAFMYWPSNFSSIMSLCREAKSQGTLCWLLTVRGSVHISQSDFSLLYPNVSSFLLKMTVNPRRAIDLNINASLEFLKMVMPKRISAMNRGTNEGLLEVEQLEQLPDVHRPKQKYIAGRLRIPHELRIRLTPQWARRYARESRRGVRRGGRWEEGEGAAGEEYREGSAGECTIGVGDLEVGEEVWMHIAPTAEEVEEAWDSGEGWEAEGCAGEG
ncbi:hypothetical protein DID88_008880 [Monilinia fructigena]|uniref:1-alkyl-2-acetylglycerophosphocholine esterase n=1 Tax=Monilinia fructigena TaxID=38457 RepID=A0A395J6P3_9HELO|nr:hypothetical protein DID88_008880 [Monilinia fructigena]